MNKFYLGATALVSLVVFATSSGVAMAKGGDDKPVEVTGMVVVDDGGGSLTVDGIVNAEIIAPTTGHDTVTIDAIATSAQKTITITRNIMLKHVQLLLQRIGNPTDRCFASARKTNPSDVSFLQTADFIGDQEYVREEFNFGSGVEFLAGEEMTMFVNAPDGNQCAGSFIYFFDLLD